MSPALGTDIASAVRQSLQQAQLDSGPQGQQPFNINFEGKNHQLLTRSQVSLLLTSHDAAAGNTTDSNSDLETLHQMMTQSRFESDDCHSRPGTAPSSGCSTPEAKRFSLFDNRLERERNANPLSNSHGSAASLSKPPSLPVKSKSTSSVRLEDRRPTSTKKQRAAAHDSPFDTMSSTSELGHVIMRSELSSSEMFLTSTTLSARSNSSTSASGNGLGWGRRRRSSWKPPESVDNMNLQLMTYDAPQLLDTTTSAAKEKKGLKNAVKKLGRIFSRNKSDKSDTSYNDAILSTHGTMYGGRSGTTRTVQSSFHTVYRPVQRPSKQDSRHEVEPRSHSTGGLESRASQRRHARKDSLAISRYSFSSIGQGARATLSRSLSQRSSLDVQKGTSEAMGGAGDSNGAQAFPQPFNLYKELADASASMLAEGASRTNSRASSDKRPQPIRESSTGSQALTSATLSRQPSLTQKSSVEPENSLSRLRTPSSGSLADYAPPSNLPKISTYNPLYDATSNKPWQEVVVEPMLPSTPLSAVSGVSSNFEPPLHAPMRRVSSARSLHMAGVSPLASAPLPPSAAYFDASLSNHGPSASDEPQPMTLPPSVTRTGSDHVSAVHDPSSLPFHQGPRSVAGPRTSSSFIPLAEGALADESLIRTADFSRLPSHHWPENVTQTVQPEDGKQMFNLMNVLTQYQKEMHPGHDSSTASTPMSKAGSGPGSQLSTGGLSRSHSHSNLRPESIPSSPAHPESLRSAPHPQTAPVPVPQALLTAPAPSYPSRPTPLIMPSTPTHHSTNTTPRTPSSHPPRPSLIKPSTSLKSLPSAATHITTDSPDTLRRTSNTTQSSPFAPQYRSSMPSLPHATPSPPPPSSATKPATPLMSSISEPGLVHHLGTSIEASSQEPSRDDATQLGMTQHYGDGTAPGAVVSGSQQPDLDARSALAAEVSAEVQLSLLQGMTPSTPSALASPSTLRRSTSMSSLAAAGSSPPMSETPTHLQRSSSSLRQRKAAAEVVFSDADGNPITPPMTGATLQASGLLFKPPGSAVPKKSEMSKLGRVSHADGSKDSSGLEGFGMTIGGMRIEAALLLGGALLFFINVIVMLHLLFVVPRSAR